MLYNLTFSHKMYTVHKTFIDVNESIDECTVLRLFLRPLGHFLKTVKGYILERHCTVQVRQNSFEKLI